MKSSCRQISAITDGKRMSKNVALVFSATILTLVMFVSVGCQTGRYGMNQANYGLGQQQRVMQPPVQPGFSMPQGSAAYGQQAYGQMPMGQPPMGGQAYGQPQAYNQRPMTQGAPQFGQNIARRFADGFVNRGINSVITSAIRLSGL